MNNDIFQLLMLVLLLENEGVCSDINPLLIMFLMLHGNNCSSTEQESTAVTTCTPTF